MLPIKLSTKDLLICSIFLISISKSFSQFYVNTPSDSLVKNATLEQAVVMSFTQKHLLNDTLIFKWKKISVSLPLLWEASVCDNGNCYTTLLDSGEMIPIIPGDNGLLQLHCTTHANSGLAVIRYALQAINTSQKIDTLTWIVKADGSVGISLLENEKIAYHFFNQIFIFEKSKPDFEKIKIYNLQGSLIYETFLENINSIHRDLFSGLFIIEFVGKENSFKQKIYINR